MATSCTIINLLQLIQTASKKIAALTILFVNTFFVVRNDTADKKYPLIFIQ